MFHTSNSGDSKNRNVTLFSNLFLTIGIKQSLKEKTPDKISETMPKTLLFSAYAQNVPFHTIAHNTIVVDMRQI